jgi:hypothetical protein
MAGISDINKLLHPTILTSFKGNLPPVHVKLWLGGEDFEDIVLENLYPFDTIETIKRALYVAKDDINCLPNFIFLGIPLGGREAGENPTADSNYIAADYLWYPSGVKSADKTITLHSPLKSLVEKDTRFVLYDGSLAPLGMASRARTMLEDILLKYDDETNEYYIPTLHAFPISQMIEEYSGEKSPISQENWNGKFAPYFPYISEEGPYSPKKDDIEFGDLLNIFIKNRQNNLDIVNSFLENEEVRLADFKISGIRQLKLVWKNRIPRFEGCDNLFYRTNVTSRRPYTRLFSVEGGAISKIHVNGVLPIPTLEDPTILQQWAKEENPVPDNTLMYLKYVHRQSIGNLPPIYGTVRIFDNGSAELILLPPRQIGKLDIVNDFRNIDTILNEAFDRLPISPTNFELGEMSIQYTIQLSKESEKFTRNRLEKRLPFFQTFFQKIRPLKEYNPLLCLRYKTVSEFAAEDKYFEFLTQYSTAQIISGESGITGIISALQNEFEISIFDARNIVENWLKQKETFTIKIPSEGEFMENYNPGIDIYIYAQHPFYSVHVYRVDSYKTFQRIFTLLSVLFSPDSYETTSDVAEMNIIVNKNENVNAKINMMQIQNKIEKTVDNELLNKEAISTGIIPGTTVEDEALTEEEKRTAAAGTSAIELNTMTDGDFSDEMAYASMMMDMMNTNAIPGEYETTMNTIMEETVPLKNEIKMEESQIEEQQQQPPQIQDTLVISKKKGTKGTKDTKDTKTSKDAYDNKTMISPQNWFINKLKEIDNRLFNYTPVKGEAKYSVSCQANIDRQPSVLTSEQYNNMIDVYENDDDLFFMEYPLAEEDVQITIPEDVEVIKVLRYGSDPSKPNYYFCPTYFCLFDQIMIRAKDFEAIEDRNGAPKPANTCPFCYGKLITGKKAEMGHTVYRRKNAPKSDEPYSDIDFHKKTSHPEKFYLPCCHIPPKQKKGKQVKEEHLWIGSKEFSHFLTETQKEEIKKKRETALSNAATHVYNSDEKDEHVSYSILLETLHDKYVVGPEKHPLESGKIAVVPTPFDEYFMQKSNTIIGRTTIKQSLLPNAKGFLRIGTGGTINESLFSVLTPLFLKDTTAEIKEIITNTITPRIFSFSHFGNLVLEFYDPTQKTKTWNEIAQRVSKEFPAVSIGDKRKLEYLNRIFNSYDNFINFINDPTKRKELRHFIPLLAEPGLFTTYGLQLIVLDWDEKNTENEITVRCPPFGVSLDRHKNSDFVFISRDKQGLYDLFVYSENKPQNTKTGEPEMHKSVLRWASTGRDKWPEVVRVRVNEYLEKCASLYRSVYTAKRDVDSTELVPLSHAIQLLPKTPYGIVRDSYNHIIGLTYRLKPGKDSTSLVMVPVIDDGFIPSMLNLNIHFDWNDFIPATADEIIQYYRDKIEPYFVLYPDYSPKNAVRVKGETDIIAVQLQNGIYIPASNISNKIDKIESLEDIGVQIVDVEGYYDKDKKLHTDFDFDINREIFEDKQGRLLRDCGKDKYIELELTSTQLDEYYQTFRLMFVNWLNSTDAGPEMRKKVEEIIFDDNLPEYEKRKRLDIILTSHIQKSLFTISEDPYLGSNTFLRRDCKLLDKNDCTGVCKWQEPDSGSSKEGKCRLHIHNKSQLGSNNRMVSTVGLFTKRIYDELVRFPAKRKQILKNKISRIISISQPIRIGDQYVIPEQNQTWINLLRMEWFNPTPEEHKYYEEMSRDTLTDAQNLQLKQKTQQNEEDMPLQIARSENEELEMEVKEFEGNIKISKADRIKNKLYDYFGRENIQQKNVKLFFPKETTASMEQPLLPFLPFINNTFETLDIAPSTNRLTKESVIKIVKTIKNPVGVIDLRGDSPLNFFVRPISGYYDGVLLFIFIDNKVGLLIDRIGNQYLSISNIPDKLRDNWENASAVPTIRKKGKTIKEDKSVQPVAEVAKESVQPSVSVAEESVQPVAEVAEVAEVEEVAEESDRTAEESVQPSVRTIESAETVEEIKEPSVQVAEESTQPEVSIIPSKLRITKKKSSAKPSIPAKTMQPSQTQIKIPETIPETIPEINETVTSMPSLVEDSSTTIPEIIPGEQTAETQQLPSTVTAATATAPSVAVTQQPSSEKYTNDNTLVYHPTYGVISKKDLSKKLSQKSELELLEEEIMKGEEDTSLQNENLNAVD